jgi:hypothetical protein
LSFYLKGLLTMAIVPFTQIAQLLAVDAKTLRQWIKSANLSLAPHATDARIKGLTIEHVHLLASLHGKDLSLQPAPASHEPSPGMREISPVALDANVLLEKLTQLEARVANQQEQIAHLALQLLLEREQRTEQRLRALEAVLVSTGQRPALSPAPTVTSQTPSVTLQRTVKRVRIIPLIEYCADGSYILICPKEGELPITPDTPEWFTWLASLSSFRFIGRSGRLSARRGPAPRSHQSWYAQRNIHQKTYCKYLGASQHVTIDRLEQIAALFQSYVQ